MVPHGMLAFQLLVSLRVTGAICFSLYTFEKVNILI